jgi:hypothetical protein
MAALAVPGFLQGVFPDDFEALRPLAKGGNGDLHVGKINNPSLLERADGKAQCVIKRIAMCTPFCVDVLTRIP